MSAKNTIKYFGLQAIHSTFLFARATIAWALVNRVMPSFKRFSVFYDPLRVFKTWDNNNDRAILAFIFYQGLKLFEVPIFLPVKNFITGYLALKFIPTSEVNDIQKATGDKKEADVEEEVEVMTEALERMENVASQAANQAGKTGALGRKLQSSIKAGKASERFNYYKNVGEAVNAHYGIRESITSDLTSVGAAGLANRYELASRLHKTVLNAWHNVTGSAKAATSQTVIAANQAGAKVASSVTATADKAGARVLEVTSTITNAVSHAAGTVSQDAAMETQRLQADASRLRAAAARPN